MDTGTLYIVGTPIGNLKDITYRAIETLTNVDFIVAEDTRVTLKLLNHYNIKNHLISYHKHNAKEKGDQITKNILAGQNCALVSDAGMPCISDPGEQLVKLAMELNIKITVIPGPCAAISALAISGLDSSRFLFEGFLSTNKKTRLLHLKSLTNITLTLIFYEAPHKLKNTLKDLLATLGNRRISIVKEITKIYENVMLTTIEKAIDYFNLQDNIKGEFVLVVEGYKGTNNPNISVEEAITIIKDLHTNKGISLPEATKIAADRTGYKKNMLYKLFIK